LLFPATRIFETDINPIAKQKVVLKTKLVRTDAPLEAPLVKSEASTNPPPESANPTAALAQPAH
jgi:hypothetical protein